VFSFPLHMGAIRLGSLDLYRHRPGPLSDDQFADAVVLAEVATDGLLDLQARVPPGSLHWRLGSTGGNRARVHQATGMIAGQLNLGVDDAMARLRAHAFGNQRSIYDVAGDVVDRRLRFE
jgi:ANTAR domain